MPEPLTDRDLADLLDRPWIPGLDLCHQAAKRIRDLAAEVDRLRAERDASLATRTLKTTTSARSMRRGFDSSSRHWTTSGQSRRSYRDHSPVR